MSGILSRSFFCPHETARLESGLPPLWGKPSPQGGFGGFVCGAKTRPQIMGFNGQLPPLWARATGEIPLPAAIASPCRVIPLPQGGTGGSNILVRIDFTG